MLRGCSEVRNRLPDSDQARIRCRFALPEKHRIVGVSGYERRLDVFPPQSREKRECRKRRNQVGQEDGDHDNRPRPALSRFQYLPVRGLHGRFHSGPRRAESMVLTV